MATKTSSSSSTTPPDGQRRRKRRDISKYNLHDTSCIMQPNVFNISLNFPRRILCSLLCATENNHRSMENARHTHAHTPSERGRAICNLCSRSVCVSVTTHLATVCYRTLCVCVCMRTAAISALTPEPNRTRQSGPNVSIVQLGKFKWPEGSNHYVYNLQVMFSI